MPVQQPAQAERQGDVCARLAPRIHFFDRGGAPETRTRFLSFLTQNLQVCQRRWFGMWDATVVCRVEGAPRSRRGKKVTIMILDTG